MAAFIFGKLRSLQMFEGDREAENLDDEQDVDTGASSNSTAVSITEEYESAEGGERRRV
jgi:hypothetical protein